MSPNPILSLPAIETIEAEDVTHALVATGSQELQVRQLDISALNTAQGLKIMNLGQRLAYANQLIKSGLVPKHFNTPEKALLAFEQGEVLGLRPIEALSRLYVIDGKVAMYAELVLSLATRAGIRIGWPQDKVDVLGVDAGGNACVVDWKWEIELRQLWNGQFLTDRMSLLWSECVAAGWTGKDTWKKHPRAMARARLSVQAVRAYRPDVLVGHYTLDELADSSGSSEAYVVDDAGNPVPKS